MKKLPAYFALPLLVLACDGETDPDPDPAAVWQVVLDGVDLDRAALSVWGSAPDSVFVVGGPLGNTPFEALALHFDGASWQELAPGGSDSFWWVHGSSASDVWMVGENGRIEHWDGSAFQAHTSGTTATIFGTFAFAPNDAWAVGGTPNNSMGVQDLVLHYDGSDWTPVTLPEQLGVALYKIWGSSSDDLYVVGEKGTIWHNQGGSWTNESGAANATLFTVWGCGADEVYAVGGLNVLRSSGDGSWDKLDVSLSNQVNGVSCGAPGQVALAGAGGLKQRLVDGAWVDEFTKPPLADLHATWADGSGVFWVVGGDFLSGATPNAERAGMVGRFGPGTVAGDVHK